MAGVRRRHRRVRRRGRIVPTVVDLIRSSGRSEEENVHGDSDDEMRLDASYSALEIDAVERAKAPRDLSPFSCPECGGALWEIRESELPRCRVGHAYAAEPVLEDKSGSVDRAPWIPFKARDAPAA
jgi:two-component system, chemotaxis family, protein-glutamate methylesterase/glutaminase